MHSFKCSRKVVAADNNKIIMDTEIGLKSKAVFLPELRRRHSYMVNEKFFHRAIKDVDNNYAKIRLEVKRERKKSVLIEAECDAMEAQIDCSLERALAMLNEIKNQRLGLDVFQTAIAEKDKKVMMEMKKSQEKVILFANECLLTMVKHDGDNVRSELDKLLEEEVQLQCQLDMLTKLLDRKKDSCGVGFNLNSTEPFLENGSKTAQLLKDIKDLKAIKKDLLTANGNEGK